MARFNCKCLIVCIATTVLALSATTDAATWVSGSNAGKQHGVYGTKGSPASGNVPGARSNSVSWTDGHGNLWFFGGYGYDVSGSNGPLNDLWKFVYSKPAADADLNGDGFVNFVDFALLASHCLTP